ncbi:endospore germination permease [Virgibacillus kekensis]|uniref:Endospore germination permease n=1 Tax=Virgibacillus kekensis TaxID=202261 RepID=A0ABV9DM12_9BACI
MRQFEYGDEQITDNEILIAIPSIVIGVGILTMPRSIAEDTVSADGWISLLVGGVFVIFLTWLVGKLGSRFPQQPFLEYASKVISRPGAIGMTLLFSTLGVLIAAYEMRVIAQVSSKYLFEETPVPVIGLTFLLVVVYAVCGTKAGWFRINMMFFPIIVFISLSVVLFTTGWFKMENLLPAFKTDIGSYLDAFKNSILSFTGFGIILFFSVLVKDPKGMPKKAAIGMSYAVVLYILFYIMCIGVFGNLVTANLQFPTIELAKNVEIPGGFFERFESIFFVIWIMAIFNTTVMALGAALMAIQSVFRQVRKEKVVFMLSPLIFLIGMIPHDENELGTFGSFLGYYGFFMTTLVTFLLLIIAKLRGVKGHE